MHKNNLNHIQPKRQSGYSLLETMMVAAIIGAMAVVGVKVMSAVTDNVKVKRTETVMMELMKAAMDVNAITNEWPTSDSDWPRLYRSAYTDRYTTNPWGNAITRHPPSDPKAPFRISTTVPSEGIAFRLAARLGNADHAGTTINFYAGSVNPEVKTSFLVKRIGTQRNGLNKWRPIIPAITTPTSTSDQYDLEDSSGNEYSCRFYPRFENDGCLPRTTKDESDSIMLYSDFILDFYVYSTTTDGRYELKRDDDYYYLSVPKPSCESGTTARYALFLNGLMKNCTAVEQVVQVEYKEKDRLDPEPDHETLGLDPENDDESPWNYKMFRARADSDYIFFDDVKRVPLCYHHQYDDDKYIGKDGSTRQSTNYLKQVNLIQRSSGGSSWKIMIKTSSMYPEINDYDEVDGKVSDNYYGNIAYITYCEPNN